MECKYCNQPLGAGETVCPHCGKDNAEEILTQQASDVEAPAAENAAQQEIPLVVDPAAQEEVPAEAEAEPVQTKAGIRLTPGKLTAIIVGAVALVALLIGLVFWGMGAKLSFDTDPSEVPEETVVATIPPDGNPDDVTCKGSYTVSDADAKDQKDVVVATAGDSQLTNSDLQIYYWLQVQQFLSEYSYYAPYMGLDYTQPLDTQLYTDGTMTWQQYFLDSAIATWHNYQALATESLALGYEIDADVRADLADMENLLAQDAADRGFSDAEEYLVYNVGPGSSVADYVEYLELYYQGYAYFKDLYEQVDPTAEELEVYFDTHSEGYSDSGITKDSGSFVDVRHILIMPQGADSSTIRTETFSDEAWAWAEARAQELLEQWKSGEATEDTFAELANAHSDDGDGVSGGLYTQVSQGDMVEAFDAWIFDEARQGGDVEIVKTEFGYHIMYFVSSQPQWEYYAESDFIAEYVTNQVASVTEKYPISVDYEKIVLGFVDMT